MMFFGTCSTFVFLFTWMTFLCFLKSKQEHVVHVRLILQRLLEYQLFVKAEKC